MRDRTKKSVKWGAAGVALLWVFVVGFDQFFGGSTFDYGNGEGGTVPAHAGVMPGDLQGTL